MQLSPQALPAWQTLQQAKPNGVPHTGAAALIEPTAISAMLAKKAFTALPSIRAKIIPCIFCDPKQRTIVPGGHPRAGARRRRQIRRSIQDNQIWAADRKKRPQMRRTRHAHAPRLWPVNLDRGCDQGCLNSGYMLHRYGEVGGKRLIDDNLHST